LTIERPRAPLAAVDIARLAALHIRALPGSLIAKLGPRYTGAFYAHCAASPYETLHVARDAGGQILAACLVSERPGDLGARLRRATPLVAAAAAHPGAWLELIRAALAAPGSPPAPQIVTLFADEAARGRGHGAALVEAAARMSAPSLYAVTEDDPENRAFEFYRKTGFRDAGTTRLNGRVFRLLARGTAPGSGPCAA
jgi:GNAT superfamily N-acetyltransferase